MGPNEEHDRLDAFRRFAVAAGQLLHPVTRDQPARRASVVDAFQDFVRLARPLATGAARQHLAALAPKVASLGPWIVDHDVLAIAGFRYVETAYTALMAWALAPPGERDISARVQRTWLRAVGVPEELLRSEPPMAVATEVRTGDGIPDLVMLSKRLVVVVEAKTGSAEHTTPGTSRLQTESYLDAVRELHSIPKDVLGLMVFITPGCTPPAASRACATSFVEFAVAIAQGLNGCDVRNDLRSAYATLITHFVTHAIPPGIDVLHLARATQRWVDNDSGSVDREILGHLHAIQALVSILHFEEAQE